MTKEQISKEITYLEIKVDRLMKEIRTIKDSLLELYDLFNPLPLEQKKLIEELKQLTKEYEEFKEKKGINIGKHNDTDEELIKENASYRKNIRKTEDNIDNIIKDKEIVEKIFIFAEKISQIVRKEFDLNNSLEEKGKLIKELEVLINK